LPSLSYESICPIILQPSSTNSCARRYEIHDTHETASEFLTQIAHGSGESERIDVSQTVVVNILRVVRKGHPVQPAFLAGFRKRDGKPIWVFEARLACALPADKADAFLQVLKQYGFECFVLPAPEEKHSSL
jgi:hypothetical protein